MRAWDEDALSYRADRPAAARAFASTGCCAPGDEIELARPPLGGACRAGARSAFGHPVRAGFAHADLGRRALGERLRRGVSGIARRTVHSTRSAATLDLIERLAPLHRHSRPRRVCSRRAGGACARRAAGSTASSARPVKHARHALKVLMKFKLLEWQAVSRLRTARPGCADTPYFEHGARALFQRFEPLDELAEESLCANSSRVGAAAAAMARRDPQSLNCA